jgi:hypothetical protein
VIDLRDEKNFEAALAECVTSQQIQNLTRERAEQFNLVTRNVDGSYSPNSGIDERVEASGETIGDENFLLEGNRLLTLRGTFRQRENMKREILQSGKRLVPYEG